jgi:hypothetical protein
MVAAVFARSRAGAKAGWRRIALTWAQRARTGGDDWGAAEVPLAEAAEAYRVEITSGPDVIRVINAGSPAATYAAADQTTDFGALPASIIVRVAQLSSTYGAGVRAESTIWL